VTVIAGKISMAKLQREVGIAVVIKAGVVPRTRVMAVLALLPTAPLVKIILCVTTKAGCWCVLVCLVGMTVRATGFDVLALQRPARGLVIKLDFQPVDRGMTFGTVLPQEALVDIVFEVTIAADVLRIAVFVSRFMAAVTVGFRVLPFQRKVGQPVVEALFVQNNDSSVTAFVVRMTGGTAIPRHLTVTPVITLFAANVICDVFMAVET
jgi:hypothetical protein